METIKFSELLDEYLTLRAEDAAVYEQGYKAYHRRLDELRAAMDAKIEGKAAIAVSVCGSNAVATFADIKTMLENVSTHQGLCALNDEVERRFHAQELCMSKADWENWTWLLACKAAEVDPSGSAARPIRTMTHGEFAATLSPTTAPVFDQKAGGWIVIARPDLGPFPKSDADALAVLAREEGITLTG